MGRVCSLLSLVLVGLFGAGCQTKQACAGACFTPAAATLRLNCPAVVTQASVTGSCAPAADASVYFVESHDAAFMDEMTTSRGGYGFSCLSEGAVPFRDCQTVFVQATTGGTCHVALSFADGYTYAADIQFVAHQPPSVPSNCTPCPVYTDPVGEPPPVDNPPDSCLTDAATATD